MLRDLWSSLLAGFRKPIFGTIVVPPNAAVDPALFPEGEYPVYCAKCGYDLRTLPDGRCPECGDDFTRGQLLVKTYLRQWSGALWRDSKARKWTWRLVFVGAGVMLISFLGLLLVSRYGAKLDPTDPSLFKSVDLVFAIARILAFLLVYAPLLFLAALVITIRYYPRGTWKRRRAIIDAIKQARGQDP